MTIKNRIGIAGIALLILSIFIGLGIGIGIAKTNSLGALLTDDLPLVVSSQLEGGRLQLTQASARSLGHRNLLLGVQLLDRTELEGKVQPNAVLNPTLDLLELEALQLRETSL